MTEAPLLRFSRFDVSDLGSVSSIFAGMRDQDRCGIYVLRFQAVDGTPPEAYVGQALDVRERFATHRRRWPDIVTLEFAPTASDNLDDAERRTISTIGREASLRNLLLTDKPGGWGDLEVSVTDRRSALLPWERDRRATIGDESSESDWGRYWRLRGMAEYSDLRSVLASYIHETVPDPVLMSGGGWALSALPKTQATRRDFRLCTVNCGSIETLYARRLEQGGIARVQVHINVSADADVSPVTEIPGATIRCPIYRSIPTTQIIAENLALARYLLTLAPVLDGAYALNTALMRKGSRLFGRFHNRAFADDILTGIHDRLAAHGSV